MSGRAAEPAGPPPRRAFSAVLFDLDGVLVDSVRAVERAWRRWAGDHGLAVQDVLAVIHGRTAREVIGMLTPHLDVAAELPRVARYETDGSEGMTVMPGALECVALASQGPWAVVTSGDRPSATARLTVAGLPVPDIMITAGDVTRGKPDPEPYQRAAAALSVPAAECVVVEDAPAGVLAARRAGMTVLAVTTTHPGTALGQADQVLAGMREVAGWLRGHPARAGRSVGCG
jgi:mannitol-1-/sugar-/sorbitol-6-phosphatase